MSWDDYLNITKNKQPRPLLVRALSYVTDGRKALDLGAGAMNDARFLLDQGFQVDAVDSSSEVNKHCPSGVDLYIETFANFKYPESKYDLVNAEYALPFNPPETFGAMFEKLMGSLKKGGIFAGQFFGPQDSWAGREGMTFHTEDQIRQLLAPFEIISLEEEKREGKTASGEDKFWHVFHVIARKEEGVT